MVREKENGFCVKKKGGGEVEAWLAVAIMYICNTQELEMIMDQERKLIDDFGDQLVLIP